MSEEQQAGLSIPINSKTIMITLTVIGMFCAVVGSWYVNSQTISTLENRVKELETTKAKETQEAIDKVERESKTRDKDLEKNHKENIENIRNKMDQIEDLVHSTQLAVGTISQDIKNMSKNMNEMRQDIKSIRKSIRRRRGR